MMSEMTLKRWATRAERDGLLTEQQGKQFGLTKENVRANTRESADFEHCVAWLLALLVLLQQIKHCFG